MIKLSHVSKVYDKGECAVHALDDVSLVISRGDFVAIMGPSGSGKSTLMNILGLLDIPSSGEYSINNINVNTLSDDQLALLRNQSIGFIFQQFNLLSKLTALENVCLPNYYSPAKADEKHGEALLTKVGLQARLEHRPTELSGGQQQRVAIARSLMNSPLIILADEPTGNLDSKSEKDILEILQELHKTGMTVILITHEESIARHASRLLRMSDGKIISDERINQLIDNKQDDIFLSIKETELKFKTVVSYFTLGYKTLVSNKVRTTLSVLGILIGVCAVITIMALGKGAQSSIESELSSLGSNRLTISQHRPRRAGVSISGSVSRLTVQDVEAIKEQIPSIKYAAPSITSNAQAVYRNKNVNTTVQGTSIDYEILDKASPQFGRFFSLDEDISRKRVAVIGTTVAKELFDIQKPIGEYIKINKVNFQIIGVLPSKGSSGGWQDRDSIIIIPIQTMMYRLAGKNYIDRIDVEIQDMNQMNEAEKSILNLLYLRHKVSPDKQEDAFRVMNMADIQNVLVSSTKTITMILSAIAAISLLVGGIGIMNIMLVSVTERTREIGLRKALGAKRRDIQLQFLAEAIVVSALGGFLGIILGGAITSVIAIFSGWNTTISINSITISVSFSVTIGIIFGIYPATIAARQHPIESLRHD